MNIEVIKMNLAVLGGSKYVHLFLMVVLLDIFIGTSKSFILGTTSSSVGLKGLLKHSLVIIVTLIVSFYMLCFEYESLAKIFIMFFIVQYLISLTESWGELGLPLPEWVGDKLFKLNDNLNKGVDNNDK